MYRMKRCYNARNMAVPSDYKNLYEKQNYYGDDENIRSINGNNDLSSRIYRQIGYD